jgi:tetratricopeptide (TPR) repeat protein
VPGHAQIENGELRYMAIPIEGYSVVAQKDRIQHLLSNGSIVLSNFTALCDDDIWRCSFMVKADAENFIHSLECFDLNVNQGPDSDAVLVNEFDQIIDPCCEWLVVDTWEKAVIAWKAGTHSKTVVAPKKWDPKVGSGLLFHDHSTMKNLEFLRLDTNVEVFLDKNTGKEVYIGRTSTPVGSMFLVGSRLIKENFVTAGEPPVRGEAAKNVAKAVEMLAKVIAEVPEWWNAHWYHGKGLMALGNHALAYISFQRAYDLESSVEYIPIELAAVCLELQKYDEAVTIAEKSAAISPNNLEVIGNLSIAYLMAGKINEAKVSIVAAIKMDTSDKVNVYLHQVITEVADGRRSQPKILADLSKPIEAKKKPCVMKLKTICYEFHKYFSTQPRHISVCPQCKTPLILKSTDPTACGLAFIKQSLIPCVDTIKSHCHTCHWWSLREIYIEYEGSGITDLLITLLPEIDKQSEPNEMEVDNSQPPWDTLYKFGDHWKNNSITAEIVEWLWGDALK